ncbi:MAG: glutathione S-transferase family protein [Pseudomonadota bacterium]
MILVHHLRVGRSVFTVWMLEELGLDYNLKIYDRDPKTMRAPDELKTAHPLGKSPVIEDGGIKLAESGAIATYLVDTYDKDGLLAPPRDDAAARATWTQWLHYPEGSAFVPFLMRLLLSREQGDAPVVAAFAAGEQTLHLDYMAAALGDKPFFLGDKFQAPDVGLTYICAMAGRLGVLGDHPTLAAYAGRMTARPAFLKAMERTGG